MTVNKIEFADKESRGRSRRFQQKKIELIEKRLRRLPHTQLTIVNQYDNLQTVTEN